MNILEAPNIQKYADTTQWIRDKVLPVKLVCEKCESTIVIDAESDLYLTHHGTIGFVCIVCKSKRHWAKPTEEQLETERKKAKWSKLTDEEYEKVRVERVVERAKRRQEYLSYGSDGTCRENEFSGSYNTLSNRRRYREKNEVMPTYERWIEEKYLPEVPPEVKPEGPNNILLNYDDLVAYYAKQKQKVVTKDFEHPFVEDVIPLIVLFVLMWWVYSTI